MFKKKLNANLDTNHLPDFGNTEFMNLGLIFHNL